MKIYINNYRDHWLSPYTILEKAFFWREIDYDEPIIKRLSDALTPFSIALQKILDVVHPKINYVKIDRWDTWSMDSTLADIALPMLKQLRDTKHGSPYVDLEDVPEALRGTNHESHIDQQAFDFYEDGELAYDALHKRWDWILGEIIFAFECKVDDSWQDKFYTGETDFTFEPAVYDTDGKAELYEMVEGPNHTYKVDMEGLQAVQRRIENGFRLFGKYYEGLWD